MIPALAKYKDIEFFVGTADSEARLNVPFAPILLQFLEQFSRVLLKSETAKRYPELVALGYWIRPANVERLRKRLPTHHHSLSKPVGTVLHIAPSNVDIQFFYSWVLSLLLGNSNIVRVSQVASESKELLLQLLRDTLKAPEFLEICQNNVFVTWPHNDAINQSICQQVDARMLWGSDESIQHIRGLNTKVGCRDIVFSDKYSISVIDSSQIESQASFCEALSRDISAFSQKACSSPRIVFDLNSDIQATYVIAKQLNTLAGKLSFAPNRGVNHLFTQQILATQGKLNRSEVLENISILHLSDYSPDMLQWHTGESLLFWLHLKSVEQLVEFVDEKCQTISYFGVAKEQLLRIVQDMPINSIDRVVPMGKALEFDIIWDGYDLFSQLTRTVSVV